MLTTVEGESPELRRFFANQEFANLWNAAAEGRLGVEERARLMGQIQHENVEARLAETGLNIYEPVEKGGDMRPFRARSAHDLSRIVDKNFEPKFFEMISGEDRAKYLRTMVEGALEVRGTFSPEVLREMPQQVQDMVLEVERARAAAQGGLP